MAVAALAAPRALEVTRTGAILAGAVAGLAAWTALSAVWSASLPLTLLEVERALLYAAAAVAFVLVASVASAHALLAGVLAAAVTVALWNVAVRIRDAGEALDLGNRGVLAEPVGYENTLGLLAALGLVLAFGFERRGALRAAAAVPLAAALAASGSRAAGLAVVVGGLVLAAFAPAWLRRPGLLVGAVLGAAIAFGSPTFEADVDRGRAAAAALPTAVGLALAAALAAAVAVADGRLRDFVPLPLRARPRLALALAVGVVAAGIAATGVERRAYWRAALDQAAEHPLAGSGAGTFVRHWLEHREVAFAARDAHSLYLESAGELGAVGLALVLVALAVPFRQAGRAPAAAAGLAVFCVHAAFDWDWEMPTATLAALACAAALAARDDRAIVLGPAARVATAAGAVAVAALALPGLLGHAALARGERAALAFRWEDSARAARRADRLLPWSPAPQLRLAVAEDALGNRDAARAALREATERDPGDTRPWLLLAEIGTRRERAEALERVERLDPLGAPPAPEP